MCILCVVQKWSRRVVTMLPWLVIPLIVLWALSQLLPPGLRFEVTSPRLACVIVLLGTLFWYEILLPQLSIYRARRSARIREQQRTQAIELQKLRKTATRRCRNCLTPYRDQNPGGGKFMCSFCGHISKRPMLDLPGPPGSSGILSDLVGKNSWICSQDWSPEGNGNWVGPVQRYWTSGGDDQCLTEKSYSGAVVYTCKLLSSFFFSVRWLCRKVFRIGSLGDDGSLDTDLKGLSKKGENGGNYQESRVEKARRKADEKRQARLEKEMLEEEERKQREEVARLIKERRKLRDEKLEAEKEHSKGLAPDGGRSNRKEPEKRRQDRRKEKDKGSSKSNSDVEELEKRAGRETEKKREFDKKSENEKRDFQKSTIESQRAHILEVVNNVKSMANKPKYFDHMKGSFFSSSRGFDGATFFRKSSQTPSASVTKSSRPTAGFVDHTQVSGNKREGNSVGLIMGKSLPNGDAKTAGSTYPQPVSPETQLQTPVLKKSWHQLFTRSSSVSPSPDANTTSRSNQNGQSEKQITQLPDQQVPSYPLHNQMHFSQSLPFTAYPLMNGSFSGSSVSSLVHESRFPLVGEAGHNFVAEAAELFEDPCYVPDPVSLLGPVSESLDNFAMDPGTGFVANSDLEEPHIIKNVSASASANVSKPSPIESPMSRLRVSEEKHLASGPSTPKSRDHNASPVGDFSNPNDQGTWQMWSSPLGQDGLGLVGGPANWLLPPGQNKSNQEEFMHPLLHKPMVSHVAMENHILPSTHSSQNVHGGNYQNGGMFTSLVPGLTENDPWLQRPVFQTLPGDGENQFPPLNLRENIVRNEMTYESPKGSASGHPFELSPVNCWSKDWATHGVDDVGNSSLARPPVGGLYPTTNPDVQSVWSFN